MRSGVIIQARCASTRLPGKILMELPYSSGISAIGQVIRRAKAVKGVSGVIVATTRNKEDDPLELLCKNSGIGCFRGDEEDVLSRFVFSSKENGFDTIVRLTADNPCVDKDIIGSLLEKHIKEGNDYTASEGYPLGMNAEIVSLAALERLFSGDLSLSDREHVTSFICANPDNFKVGIKNSEKIRHLSGIRLTLDHIEDYALLCLIFESLYADNELFGISDILRLFEEKPWLRYINQRIVQKRQFRTFDDELDEALKVLDLQGLGRVKEYLRSNPKCKSA